MQQASEKDFKNIKGGGKCTGACLSNTRLVLLGDVHLTIILCFGTCQVIHPCVRPSASPCGVARAWGRLGSSSASHD
jgi:hypothetical protein